MAAGETRIGRRDVVAGGVGTIVSLVHAGPDPAEQFGDTRIVRVVDQRTTPSGDRNALLQAVDDLTLRARITNDQIDALAGDRSRVRALGTAVDPNRA
ncbi:hypothetical protein AB0L40_04055 [Patulibacter sp. NPDC049589]|uniref:hypothetical protein n=1 Tax=Patulibacter sp. NPDC049589 TaxID=3154731 RepID=UPI00341D94C6